MSLFALPAFPDPANAVFWDDFISATYNTRVWAVTGTGSITSLDQVGGRIRVRATAGNTYRFNHGNYGAYSVAAKAQVTWRTSLLVPTGGTGGSVECGLQATSNPTTNKICFQAIRGTANYQCLCQSGGVGSPVDSGIAVDTNPHNFFIETLTGSVNFYIDGVLRANITSDIPSSTLQPYVNCAGSTTVVADANVDWVQVTGVRA